MTPSSNDGPPERSADDSQPPPSTPNLAYDAAFGRAVRDAIDAAPPELPPPALLAAILTGGTSVATSERASDERGPNAESAFRPAVDAVSARPSYLTLDRSDRAPDLPATRLADGGRRRPAWPRWTPVAAAAGLALAVGLAGLGTIRTKLNPRVASRPRPDSGAGVPVYPQVASAPSVRSPGIRSPSAIAGGGVLSAPARPGAGYVDTNPARIVTFLRRGDSDTGYTEELPYDSMIVALGTARKGVMDFDQHRNVENIPVIDGVQVSVLAHVARDAVTDTLVRAVAAAARDLRTECRRRGVRATDADPEKTKWWFIYVDPALLADGSALARAQTVARVSGGADAPTVWILNALTFGPSLGGRPTRPRTFLGRRDLPRAVVTVSYPEVCR